MASRGPACSITSEDGDAVPGPAARDGDHDIKALVEASGGGMGGDPEFRGASDAPAGIAGYRVEALGLARPMLHFDEDDCAPAPHDEVDLANRRAVAAGED